MSNNQATLHGRSSIQSTQNSANSVSPAPYISEIDREMQGVDAQFTYLHERLNMLLSRLQPVLSNGKASSSDSSVREIPDSNIGNALRSYADRAENLAGMIDITLQNLALA